MKKSNFLEWPQRINRIRHFSLILLMLLALLAMGILFAMLDIAVDVSAYIIVCFWISIILLIKVSRLHDINCSAWWALVFLVPFFGWLFAFALFFISGTKGANKFGPAPERASKFEYIVLFLLALVTATTALYFLYLFFSYQVFTIKD